ncbi:MAG: AMP-binding protein [Gammaproteobacteria bacterium]|nr:AMP-binding protein [Gammaproteobacteria bacterium]MCP5135846.1 AMP-binding protein [Gammaproteobacteria bacterium]
MSTLLFQPHPILSDKPPSYDPGESCPFICEREAQTLGGLLVTRVLRTPDNLAYRWFGERDWQGLTWSEIARRAGHWQRALLADGIKAGDRIAIMLPNGPDWVSLDLAALGLGLIVVPLFVNDRAESAAYCLAHSEARLLMLPDPVLWHEIATADPLPELKRVVTIAQSMHADPDRRVEDLETWLAKPKPIEEERYEVRERDPDAVATICYTSGTTGRPKGVTLTHRNILWNAESGLRAVHADENDHFLSFLPLSHMLERTVGYYIPMMCGAQVSFARGISELPEDLLHEKPTILIAVPRIFERIEEKVTGTLAKASWLKRTLFQSAVSLGWERFQRSMGRVLWCPRQWLAAPLQSMVGEPLRAVLGGRLRFAIIGGASLSEHTSRLFIGLGIRLLQGYGMTETSPVISVNRLEDDDPTTVGLPLQDVEIRIGDDQELWVRSPGVMRGYWKKAQATEAVLDSDGWLRTGDQVEIHGARLRIVGRVKDIMVMSTGEKLSAPDMEAAICRDSWFDQAIVIGDRRPCISALVVLNESARNADKRALLARLNATLSGFPGYAQVHSIEVSPEPWTIENELLTPTLKVRRHVVEDRFAAQIARLACGR